MRDLGLVASLFAPLFAGLVFHGLCIRYGWLRGLVIPIDGGATLRGRRLFGDNKTYRGVVAVAAGSGLGYALGRLAPALQTETLRTLSLAGTVAFGIAIGAAAMLSELANSVLKRQLGVAPGATSRGLLRPVLYVLDQVDFLIGAWLVAAALVNVTIERVLWSVAFVLVVHQLVSAAGAALGMRTSAR